MADNRYLIRQRQTWYVVVEVPPSLRSALGAASSEPWKPVTSTLPAPGKARTREDQDTDR